MIADLARRALAVYADPLRACAERTVVAVALRNEIAAELGRTGSVVAELVAFDLPPDLQDNRRGAVEFEESLRPAPRTPDDDQDIAVHLVQVFMFAAALEQRLNALRAVTSTAA